jgi:Spy/CpxP family protein refolding chaperone
MTHLPPFLHGLDLSEAQRDKVFALMHAEAPRLRDQAKALRQSHAALQALTRAEEFDASRAKELADAGAKALADMALARASLENQVFKLLTPEQRERMQAMGDGPGGRFNRPGWPD